jgi:hypothetical protein
MKSESRGWKLPALIGSLVIVALIINFYFFTNATARREAKAQEQRQAEAATQRKQAAEKLAQEKKDAEDARQRTAKEAEAKRLRDQAEAETNRIRGEAAAKAKAVENAAVERARLHARYMNSGFARKPGIVSIGIAIASESGTMNPSIATALAQRLKSSDVQFLNSFFKPEFVADNYVARIFSGDTAIFDRLELTNSLNAVLVGKESVNYSTNPALENTVTANLRLEVMVLPVGLSRENQSWNFAANGIGFRSQEARQAAEDRIVEQIAKHTNMVLTPRF